MPYTLTQITPTRFEVRLWPHNTLAPRGFVAAIALGALLLAVPLLAVIGNKILWGLLPFAALALWGLYYALQRNWRDRQILEALDLSCAEIRLRRINPRGPEQTWQADPHWVTLSLQKQGGPVPNYLTLTGGGREVELGAFLTPAERITLQAEVSDLLIRLKSFG